MTDLRLGSSLDQPMQPITYRPRRTTSEQERVAEAQFLELLHQNADLRRYLMVTGVLLVVAAIVLIKVFA